MQNSRDAVISAQLENTDYDDLHYCTAGTGSRAQPVQASRHRSMTADKIIPTYAQRTVLNTVAADQHSFPGGPSLCCL